MSSSSFPPSPAEMMFFEPPRYMTVFTDTSLEDVQYLEPRFFLLLMASSDFLLASSSRSSIKSC